MKLQLGDIIAVDGFFKTHIGVYVGPRGWNGKDVVHNDISCCVRLVGLSDFADNRPVRILYRVNGWYGQRSVVQRALTLIGRPYDLINFNCEHAAYYALTGLPQSPQLKAAVVFFTLVAAVALGLAIAEA